MAMNSGKYGGSVKPEPNRGQNREINRQSKSSGGGDAAYGSGMQRGYGNGEDAYPAKSANGIRVGMKWPNENYKETLRGAVAYEGNLADAEKRVEKIFEDSGEE